MERYQGHVVGATTELARAATRRTMASDMDRARDDEAAREAAFRELADEHLRDAYGLAFAVLRDSAQARDATHDAFITAWERWHDLREPARFDSWFKRILVNTCRDRLRKASRQRATDIDAQADLLAVDPTDDVHDRHVLAAAIASLGPDDRVVLALRYYRDLKIDDIAAVLDIPSNTVTSRLHRAHQRLRAALDTANQKEDRDG